MQTKQSEEPRALSLDEMIEVNGGSAAGAICSAGFWGFDAIISGGFVAAGVSMGPVGWGLMAAVGLISIGVCSLAD